MTDPKRKPISSIHAFIKQTALMIRGAANKGLKGKNITKKSSVSNTNKIDQIAKMLRFEVAKFKKKKKQK